MGFLSGRLAAAAALLLLLSVPVLSTDVAEASLSEYGSSCYTASCNSTTDTSCICSSFSAIQDCLQLSKQPVAAYYTDLRVLYYDCDKPRPIWTIDPEYWTSAIIVFVIQTLFFSLRVASRVTGMGKWGWDDNACVVAYVLLVGQLVVCIFLGYYGFYNNYWTLEFSNLPYWSKANFARSQLYALGLGASKASIIALYQRVFEGARLRWVLIGTQVFNALLALSFVVAAFLVSQPFGCQFGMMLESKYQPENCTYNDVWDGSGAYSIVNAAFDIWLVAVPACVVWKLQMRTDMKINVVAVFATGILTCLIAILRFVTFRVESDRNLSPETYQRLFWTTYYAYYAELTSCFVIACLPAVRQLLGKRAFPALKTQLGAVSSTFQTNRGRGQGSMAGSQSWRDTLTISGPVDGSFQLLTTPQRAEDRKRFSKAETFERPY